MPSRTFLLGCSTSAVTAADDPCESPGKKNENLVLLKIFRGLVVSVLALSFDDPSLNHAGPPSKF